MPTIPQIAAAFAIVSVSSPLLAEELIKAQSYDLLGVEASMKLAGSLHFGRIIIQVKSDEPKEVLATASVVAHKIVDDNTLEAIQLFAYGQTPRSNGYEFAEITYSSDPNFMGFNGWEHKISGAVDEAWSSADDAFQFANVKVPVDFEDPSNSIAAICPNLIKCSEGQTSLGMP